MSHRSPLSPSHNRGFMPLSEDNYNMQNNDIPLTQVKTNGSSTGTRKRTGDDTEQMDFRQTTFPPDGEKSGFFRKTAGRRKLKHSDSKTRVNSDGEEDSVNAMGRLYKKVVNFSVVTRYMVFVVPIGALIAIPIIVGSITDVGQEAYIGGMKLVWFFTWIEAVWLALWTSKIFSQFVPGIFMFLCGVVSSGTRKYAQVIRNLEIPLSLILWAAASLATFTGLLRAPGNRPLEAWTGIMQNILACLLIASGIYFGEKLIIQLISVSYQQRSFNARIKDSKHNVYLLGLLYDASRSLFPMNSQEFAEEDYLISDSLEAMIARGIRPKKGKSGSQTPMKLIGDIGRFGDKLTSAFGNIASEISGKQVFNPNSAHSIVIQALEKKQSSEALARRIWLSFVVEGHEALMLDDIREVLGPGRREEADEAFLAIDGDGNGDISLDEMIMKVVEIGRERKAITSSMKDIGQAIAVFDSVLVTIVFVVVVFVFVAFLNASFVTTLATAGTTLLSLSFVFAVTAQEFLGSCIFLFVKHPYDVGDRVDIVGPSPESLIVEQISLLYTIFKRIDCMKMVQVPNIVLNNMWIENVTRSSAMKEQMEMSISFDTSLEDIEALRSEMEAFVRHPDNARDFQPDLVIECAGVGNMDKLVLKAEIRHKSNWSNETVRAARRSKFMCALVLALRKVPIYAPGGGGTPLGDPGNPTYSVAVSDEIAAASREKAAKAKEEKRLHPTTAKSPGAENTGKSTAVDMGSLGSIAENKAANAMNSRNASDDAGRDNLGGKNSEETLGRENSLERTRSHEIENLRQGLLKRESTRGRRRPGEAVRPLATGTGGPGFMVTPSSPNMARSQQYGQFDEEANMGMEGRAYNQPAGPHNPNDTATPGTSYSMFPPSSRAPLSQHAPGQAASQQFRRPSLGSKSQPQPRPQ